MKNTVERLRTADALCRSDVPHSELMRDAPANETQEGGAVVTNPRQVRFEPMGHVVRVKPGMRVYDAAMAAGVPLAQSCGGEGICGRCGVRVLEGDVNLGPEGRPEQRRKRANRVDPALRLACLASIRGPVVVTTDYW